MLSSCSQVGPSPPFDCFLVCVRGTLCLFLWGLAQIYGPRTICKWLIHHLVYRLNTLLSPCAHLVRPACMAVHTDAQRTSFFGSHSVHALLLLCAQMMRQASSSPCFACAAWAAQPQLLCAPQPQPPVGQGSRCRKLRQQRRAVVQARSQAAQGVRKRGAQERRASRTHHEQEREQPQQVVQAARGKPVHRSGVRIWC